MLLKVHLVHLLNTEVSVGNGVYIRADGDGGVVSQDKFSLFAECVFVKYVPELRICRNQATVTYVPVHVVWPSSQIGTYRFGEFANISHNEA